MSPRILKRIALGILILIAAGIAFWSSFRNAVDMASIVQTDADGILRVKVIPVSDSEALHLQIEYRHAELRGADGRPLPLPFPQPFTAFLVNEAKQVVARVGNPDADGILPAIDEFPRSERYLWLVFPKIYADGKPASLLIRNPLCDK